MVSENSTNSAVTKTKRWLPGAVVVLLVVLTLGVCTKLLERQYAQIIIQNQQLSQQVASTESMLTAQLAAQTKVLKHTQTALKQQTDAAVTDVKATLASRLTTLDKVLEQVRIALQQQTAVTYAALGKVIPVKMPAEFDAELTAVLRP
jgi:succinate dehydrogenase hydrophobic anchor subunit